jgi:hypothetical protein
LGTIAKPVAFTVHPATMAKEHTVNMYMFPTMYTSL